MKNSDFDSYQSKGCSVKKFTVLPVTLQSLQPIWLKFYYSVIFHVRYELNRTTRNTLYNRLDYVQFSLHPRLPAISL